MLRQLWGKITGADKKLSAPDQQASVGGRIGDYTIIYPYGSYCDLPDNVYTKEVGRGALIPVTLDRPDDVGRGEPVFFHPVSKSRIIFRNNGDIEIITANTINVSCDKFNVDADTEINLNAPNIKTIGDFDAIGGISTTGTFTNNGKDISNLHKHEGSPTAPDGPVSDTGQVV